LNDGAERRLAQSANAGFWEDEFSTIKRYQRHKSIDGGQLRRVRFPATGKIQVVNGAWEWVDPRYAVL